MDKRNNHGLFVQYVLLFVSFHHAIKTVGGLYLDIYPNATNATPKYKSFPLYFGLMLSLSGNQQSTGALAGVQAALDDINSREDLLPGYSLHYTLTDSQVATGYFIGLLLWLIFDSGLSISNYPV